jgi:repressor LexA
MLNPFQTRSLSLLWRTLSGLPRSHPKVKVPLLGFIVAGKPQSPDTDADTTVDTCLEVDADTLRLPKNARTFALKVRGDSMKGAGILDGDVVILEFREPRHGDIVAAAIDGETTLKRYLEQNGRPYLRAANPKYPDLIPAHELLIQGVQIALLRMPQR